MEAQMVTFRDHDCVWMPRFIFRQERLLYIKESKDFCTIQLGCGGKECDVVCIGTMWF